MALLIVGDHLDEHGGRQFAGIRDQRVVGVEFDCDRLIGEQPLNARHLLDLESDGFAIFENEGDDRPNRNATQLLEGDDPGTIRIALPFVFTLIGDVVDRELRSHLVSSGIP